MFRLRAVLYLVYLVVTIAPISLAVLLALPLSVHVRYWLAQVWTGLAIGGARVICGVQCKVEGWHNLPDGPAIIMPKHQSTWETLWLQCSMPRELCFVYKRELHYLPFFGWAIASVNQISIDRSKGSDAFEQVVQQGVDRLAHGWWIVMFPEGTRTAPGTTRRYKTGGARLAVRTGAPAVPIAVNSGECWPRSLLIQRPGTITVSIGPPIESAGRTSDDVAAAVEAWIETEMRRIAPHRYSGPYVPARAGEAADRPADRA